MESGKRKTYVATAYSGPIDVHNHVVRVGEGGDGALFIDELVWGLKDEGRVLQGGTRSAVRFVSRFPFYSCLYPMGVGKYILV